MRMKKSKRIELTEECIMHISIEAIHKKTNFKKYVECFLEQMRFGKYKFIPNPISNTFEKSSVREAKKNKHK